MQLNVAHAAKMVAETELFTVAEVAKRNDTTRQTVRNHLAREAKGLDEGAAAQARAFAEACRREREFLRAEKERRKHEWADVAVSSLRELLAALEDAAKISRRDFADGKIEKGRIRELAGAVKIIGELDVGKRVLFGGPRTNRQDPAAPEAPGGVRGTGADALQ